MSETIGELKKNDAPPAMSFFTSGISAPVFACDARPVAPSNFTFVEQWIFWGSSRIPFQTKSYNPDKTFNTRLDRNRRYTMHTQTGKHMFLTSNPGPK